MAKTYRLTQHNVSCVTAERTYNYVELESTIDDSGSDINFSFWFHWHEPKGFNCFGVAYMWYIRFYDKNGNKIKDLNITPTNVSNYAARLFYFPANSAPPAECVLDRYANDSTPTRRDVFPHTYSYSTQSNKCKQGELLRTPDNTRMTYTLHKSDIPSNAYAYGNFVTFSQYIDSRTGQVQDPTNPANQFGSYAFPSGNIAIDSDDLIIDGTSKIYYKSGSWTTKGKVYKKISGNWEKRYLYKKVNGTWVQVP